MLETKKVVSSSLLKACRRFLAQDPVVNILPLGDLYMPLLRVSDIYCANERGKVLGVCSVYHAFSLPSIVCEAFTPEAKRILIREAMSQILGKFLSVCSPSDIALFSEYSAVLRIHHEQQMITDSPKHFEFGNMNAEKVKKSEMELLNKFYVEHHSEAWTPIQFKTGPYYCVKQEGKIVSAAGVHIVTTQIAQLGNIITDEAYRNQGFATRCTYSLTADLASKGRIISLFVRTDNVAAIHMYEKLGFSKKRDISFLMMQKNT